MSEEVKWRAGDTVVVNENGSDEFVGKEFPVVNAVTNDITIINTSSIGGDPNYYIHNYKLNLKSVKEQAMSAEQVTTTTAVTTAVEEEQPKVWAMEVHFVSDTQPRHNRKTYEYLAFGLFDELCEATHAVVCKEQYTDLDQILGAEDLAVVRVLNVKPVSQLRYSGTAKYIVDIVDATAFVERNMKAVRTEQLRRDIKARIEKVREITVLEKMVEETNDEVAKELLAELKGLN